MLSKSYRIYAKEVNVCAYLHVRKTVIVHCAWHTRGGFLIVCIARARTLMCAPHRAVDLCRPFTRKDVIMIQDPNSSELREIVKFEHIIKHETFQEQKQGELNVPEETKRILAKAGLSSSLSEGNKVCMHASVMWCYVSCALLIHFHCTG
jgi:hypothetical protein